mmetsp:Transcript_149/g.533  ORF Transcript_149/g.533 Transcript_149/m.533 type:complete len:316 (-) Transcript_149:642-1589(-)
MSPLPCVEAVCRCQEPVPSIAFQHCSETGFQFLQDSLPNQALASVFASCRVVKTSRIPLFPHSARWDCSSCRPEPAESDTWRRATAMIDSKSLQENSAFPTRQALVTSAASEVCWNCPAGRSIWGADVQNCSRVSQSPVPRVQCFAHRGLSLVCAVRQFCAEWANLTDLPPHGLLRSPLRCSSCHCLWVVGSAHAPCSQQASDFVGPQKGGAGLVCFAYQYLALGSASLAAVTQHGSVSFPFGSSSSPSLVLHSFAPALCPQVVKLLLGPGKVSLTAWIQYHLDCCGDHLGVDFDHDTCPCSEKEFVRASGSART